MALAELKESAVEIFEEIKLSGTKNYIISEGFQRQLYDLELEELMSLAEKSRFDEMDRLKFIRTRDIEKCFDMENLTETDKLFVVMILCVKNLKDPSRLKADEISRSLLSEKKIGINFWDNLYDK